MKFIKKAKRGFTLVELVVVIAVIAILAAVSVGAYFGVTDSANNSKLEQEAKMVHTNIQLVGSDTSSNHVLTRQGIKIDNELVFEQKFNQSMGIDYNFEYGADPTDIPGDVNTILFYNTSIVLESHTPNTLYTHFAYYVPTISGKRAEVEITSGNCTIAKDLTFTVDNEDHTEDNTHTEHTYDANGNCTFEGCSAHEHVFATNTPSCPCGEANPNFKYIDNFTLKVNGETHNEDNNIILDIGSDYSLVFEVATNPVSTREFIVEYTNDEVAEVTNNNGNYSIKALSQGLFNITVKSTIGNYEESYTFEVAPVAVTGITLSGNPEGNSELKIGETVELTTAIAPQNATNKNVTITVSPEDAFEVDGTSLTAVKSYDSVTIEASIDNIKSNKLTYKILEEGFILKTTDTILDIDSSLELDYEFTNVINSRQNVTITSSDTNVVSLDGNKLTAIANGQSEITVKATDLDITKKITITVITKVTALNVSETKVTLEKNEIYTIVATVEPETASNQNLIYSIEEGKEDVVSIENNIVTALKTGTAEVTISTTDGSNLSKIVTFNVNPISVKELTITQKTFTINLDETAKIDARVNNDAENKSITYTVTEGNDVVTVDGSGNITPIKNGTAKISVKTSNTEISDIVTVTVENKKTIYFLDQEWWHEDGYTSYIYAWSENSDGSTLNMNEAWPGEEMSFVKEIRTTISNSTTCNLYSYVFDMSLYNNLVIANVKNGSIRCSTLDIKNITLDGGDIVVLNSPAQKSKLEYIFTDFQVDKWNYDQNFNEFKIYLYTDKTPYGTNPYAYVYSEVGSTIQNKDFPGIQMSWVKDNGSYKLWTYTIDLSIYSAYKDVYLIFSFYNGNSKTKEMTKFKIKDKGNDFYKVTGSTYTLNVSCSTEQKDVTL